MLHFPLKSIYDRLWLDAADALRRDDLRIDRYLRAPEQDQRLGLSLIIRPSATVTRRIGCFIRQLQEIEPAQYYYQPGELHVTVLSLFTATEDYARHLENIPVYADVLQSVLPGTRRFRLGFRGVTASSGAILIQGFPEHDALTRLRGRLRDALRSAGLGDCLDMRYPTLTAHATAVRFSEKLRNRGLLVRRLSRLRRYPFGSMTVNTVQWVKNDWYMSADKVQVLGEFELQ